MTPEQFWFGDIGLLRAYQKAYIRHLSYFAWVCGAKNMDAFSKAMYNNFGRKSKTSPTEKYGNWEDPIQKLPMHKPITKDAESAFREQQLKQAGWLSQALSKK